jgi:ubiquitin C-terminal hydrolase
VVHLNRKDDHNVKQFLPVVYPLVFELPESQVSTSAVLASYELVAVARHRTVTDEGTQKGGHYVADVREPDGSWWVCNDESVLPLRASRASACPADPGSIEDTPYLLFYERTTI